MKHRFSLYITKVHIIHLHITLQGGIGKSAVTVGMLPCPAAGVLIGFRDGAVRGNIGIYQSNIAVVRFRCFIHQGKDTLGTGKTHDDGVNLLGQLVDVAGKLLGHV